MTDFLGEISLKYFEVFVFYGPESSETTGKMFRFHFPTMNIFLMSPLFGPSVSKAIWLMRWTCFSVCRWNRVEWCEVLPAGISVAHSCKVLPCGAVWLQQIIHLVTPGEKQHGKVSRPCLLRPPDGIEGKLLFLKWSCLLYVTDTWAMWEMLHFSPVIGGIIWSCFGL